MTAVLVAAGALGLVVGSFLIVVIHRVPRDGPPWSGSCYFPVEVGTALLFVAVTARFGLTAELAAYLYLAAIAVALAMIDLAVHRLPNAIVLPSYVVGALLLAPAAAVRADWAPAGRGLLAMAALWVIYFSLA